MPKISIIIPAYITNEDQWRWLNDAANSVTAQSFRDWEIVTVDDFSPFKVEGPNEGQIRVIHHDARRGAGAARNTGIAAATGDYLLCLDADDKLKPDALQLLWDARCPSGVVYGDLEYFGDKVGLHTLPDWSLALLLKGSSPLPVTALHPRDAWRTAGGFDEQLPGMEDVDYWIKLAQIGVCGQRIPKVIFEYRRHADSRQAGLEANNRGRMHQCVEIIQHRYRKAISEMNTIAAKCSKCPGKGGPGLGVKMEIPPEVGKDRVTIQYVGPLRGSFTVHGFGTGAKYRVEGKGATLVVDVRDTDSVLNRQTAGRPDYEIIAAVGPETPVNTTPGTIDNPPGLLVEITDMNAPEAIEVINQATDMPDLAVWLAEERAQKKPRTSVIAAVEARIGELTAE